MTKQYDLVVVGTGTGASSVAARCRAAGWTVAVIDHLPFGGTCALRGCDPKKILVGAVEAIDHVRRMRGHGLAGGEPAIAWGDLMGFKRGFTDPVPAMKENGFAKSGIDAYHGRARFCGPRSVGGLQLPAAKRLPRLASGLFDRPELPQQIHQIVRALISALQSPACAQTRATSRKITSASWNRPSFRAV